METSIADLTRRLERLEDLEAIRHTWRDYCTRLDSADWPALGDVFTEDAILEMDGLNHLVPGLDGEYQGRATIIEDFYRRTGSGRRDSAERVFSTGHVSTKYAD